MTAAFCGHGEYNYDDAVKEKLRDVIEKLIIKGADMFLIGGYGSFDLLAALTLKEFKQLYPYINSVYVTPYINREWKKELYDYSEYPPIEQVPKRLAICKRNEYMVNSAEVIIAYVNHDWGGAVKMYDYAKKKDKCIINLGG